ncbi:NAD(P)H-binding protein [Photobacterium sp. BZF1]|uniref:NmrA family NAD(P)-binding protein n=1 Tax=Photobacterium sp. BZF1 TaxID=1904457 RepID=UPI001653A521|nr:NAD(P)H-binding protein [Photobacterium sp. BZF1]MBC7002186.1 NAD(P)H-binding protein [Photobacterium sp. BZF1]
MSDRKLLITGASGKLGQQVIEYLLNDFNIPANQLIATSRNAASLSELADKGVDVREADFSNPASLEAAFAGADNLLLISIDAIGQRSELHRNAVLAAQNVGIKHLTYTSMPAADTSPVVFAFEHEATEKAITDSQISNWTILRNNWYFENLTEFFASTLQTQAWLTAAKEGKTAQLSRLDLAYAAAASVAKALNGKQTLTLNGPESLTTEQMAAKINQALGLNIQVIHQSDEELKAQLESFGLPEGIVSLVTTMDQHARGAYSDGSSQDFEVLTGRKPQDFSQWLEANKAMLSQIAQGA